MYAVAVCSAAFVCEQFVVAMEAIQKENEGGDREARAQLDEAVVLEEQADGVRDSTAAPPRSPLTSPRVCVCEGLDCRTPSLSLDFPSRARVCV